MLNYYFSNLMETKKCNMCGKVKLISEFYKQKSNKDGLCLQCKYCANKVRKEYYKKHLKERIEYQKKYKKEHRKEHTEYNKKDRALLKNWYIKEKLIQSGWEKENITEEIIEEKRNMMKTKRLISKINKVINQVDFLK